MKPDELIKLIATFKQLISELFFQRPRAAMASLGHQLLPIITVIAAWALGRLGGYWSKHKNMEGAN